MLKFDHINILGNNLDDLVEYYSLFGMSKSRDGFDGNHGCCLENGNNIVFWRKEGVYGSESGIEVVFKTKNIHEVYRQLNQYIPDLEPPYKMDWGFELRTHDPVGNVIFIVEE